MMHRFGLVLLFLVVPILNTGCAGLISAGANQSAPVAPSIATHPANQAVTAGQTATFSVAATGTAPLSYQWSKNGAAISGATSSSYTTPATTSSDNETQFTAVVSNTTGSVTSNPAMLSVNAAPVAPSITTQPASQTVTAGQTASFSVAATGTAPLSYQWRKNGTVISGATSSSYTTPATTSSDNGAQFTVVVSNTAGSVTSNSATLTVNAPVAPSITAQPASQSVTAGQTATFTVAATGTAPLNYQWQRNSVAISGATSSSYTTPTTTSSDNGAQFTVVVSNTAGGVTSNPATLTVNAAPPSITTQPASQTVTAGQTATFSVAATGTAPLSYQWQRNSVAISGATSSSYTTPTTTSSDNGAQFTVVVSNTAGGVTSNPATLTVNAPVAPSITTQPTSQTVTAGQTATFSVAATGTAPLSYQWRKNSVAIAGATSSSYTTPATTSSDDGAQFTVVVSNTVGTVTSAAATLTVNAAAPGIQVSPTSINFGNSVVGTTLSQVLIITNTGTATLSITQMTVSGPPFSVSGFSLPLNVVPGQQTTVTVAFLPTSVGAASGNVSIVSNAPTSPTTIPLSGTGIAATYTLGINPASLSFGDITTGTSSAPQNATITNTGNSNVTITQINVLGAGFSASGVSAGTILTPNQSVTLNVVFAPTTAGSVAGSVSVLSSATNSPTVITATGNGIPPVSIGPQFYVATTGNDANSGTSPSAPWRTIQKAMNSATPGSTVNILAGTYNQRLTLNVSGTAGNYITFQPYNFSVPAGGCGGYTGTPCGGDQVILDYAYLGTVTDTVPFLMISGKSHIRIQGLTFRNFTCTGPMRQGVRIEGSSSFVEFKYNKFFNNRNTYPVQDGTSALLHIRVWTPANNITFYGNELGNISSQGSEALTAHGATYVTVENNWIHDTDHIAIDMLGGANNYVVRGNKLEYIGKKRDGTWWYGRAHVAIYNDGGNTGIMERNIVSDSGIGFQALSEPGLPSTHDVTIRNNIVQRSNTGIVLGTWYSSTDGSTVYNISAYNNTLYGNTTGVLIRPMVSATVTWENNIFANNSTNYANPLGWNPGNTGYNLYFGGGTGPGANNLTSNPLFVGASTGDFSLQPTSSAINAGNPSTPANIVGTLDFAGNPRILGGRIDMGAHEQ